MVFSVVLEHLVLLIPPKRPQVNLQYTVAVSFIRNSFILMCSLDFYSENTERREYFDPNPYGSAGLDAQSRPPPDLDIKKYQSMDMPGRGVYRDSRNWTNTFDRFPAHTSDTYSDPAYRKGLKEGQSMFYTYQNKTRTAYADTHGVADVGGESWSQKRINNSKVGLASKDFNKTDSVHFARGLSRCSGRIAR